MRTDLMDVNSMGHFTKDCPGEKGEQSKSEESVQQMDNDGYIGFHDNGEVLAAKGCNKEAY